MFQRSEPFSSHSVPCTRRGVRIVTTNCGLGLVGRLQPLATSGLLSILVQVAS